MGRGLNRSSNEFTTKKLKMRGLIVSSYVLQIAEMFKMKRFKDTESVLASAVSQTIIFKLNNEDELLSLCSYAYGNVQRSYQFDSQRLTKQINNPNRRSQGNILSSAAKNIMKTGNKTKVPQVVTEEEEEVLKDYYRERAEEKYKHFRTIQH